MFSFPKFENEELETAFWEFRAAAWSASTAGRKTFNALSVLYCAVLGLLNPLAATVSLILWIYCRVGKRTVGCLILGLIVSYMYLVYAFANREPASASLELSLLVALNAVALHTRLSWEAIARTLYLRNDILENLATLDELTGVYCRRQICELGNKEFNRSRRSEEPFTVMLVDVDHLKSINDRFGHSTGDKVLVDLAAAMRNGLRSEDLLGRYGGDEFLVVLPNSESFYAERTADRLRRTICSVPVIHNGPNMRLSVSIGMATIDRQTCDFQSLVDRADIALYEAKTLGRNQVRAWFAPGNRAGSRTEVGEITA